MKLLLGLWLWALLCTGFVALVYSANPAAQIFLGIGALIGLYYAIKSLKK